ncbi:DUF3010 family protein [Megalodesulfovibrio gigas]|uniref:Uncharacterized protein n=1 Tax=Megalodesulfovibrio gigas (strain ATCC 19364 / DSM 1382 / NCIMB 9332 / VKM B-1759) TaxID=1121448 RepID=T2GAF4_MEGG1|nr:DUF3010 family protein [Megalodesulfovibrio gigas]AGW13154.1 hypothetical protein DGI_1302 [Megalodesulfovibrio gigas DSM 1382 = ATCC 19364]
MKVLGVTPSAKDVMWAILEGTAEQPKLVPCEMKKQRFATAQDESSMLYELFQFIQTFIHSAGVNKLCVLQAGSSQYGSSSALRIKVESVFQMAGKQRNIPVQLVPPQTLRAQEKKFSQIAGGNPEKIFNDGNEFKPKPWKDTVLVAWIGLIQ